MGDTARTFFAVKNHFNSVETAPGRNDPRLVAAECDCQRFRMPPFYQVAVTRFYVLGCFSKNSQITSVAFTLMVVFPADLAQTGSV
jgi:hypothetical protein